MTMPFAPPARSRAWEFIGDMCLFVGAALGGWGVLTTIGILNHANGYCS